MVSLNKIVEKAFYVAAGISFTVEPLLREGVKSGSINYNPIVGSLNDFVIPYVFSTAVLSSMGKIKEKYRIAISAVPSLIFTINEFMPFIPRQDFSGLANTYDPNDLIAFGAASILAYCTAKIVNSERPHTYFENKTLENQIQ